MDGSTPTSRLPLNPHVAALPPYNAGLTLALARAASGREDVARLASNENPDGCAPGVRAALASLAWDPSRYADPACTALRGALAARLGIDPGLIVMGNGSEEMIAALCRAVLVPGAEVVTVVPSFGLHEIEPLACGARVVKVPMTAEAGFDLPALEAALAGIPRLLILSSPWNPVGPGLDAAALGRLVAALRPGTLLALDEAYVEFAEAGAPDALALLRDSGVDHIVLRTFSKAWGLAGLRVGHAICSDERLARAVGAARTPFNVNAAAQAAALAALEDEAWMRASVARTIAERNRVGAALMALGLRPAPSQTNFLFLDCGADAGALAARLLADGIIVKPWREAGYERFLRLTIGVPADNDRVLDALRRLR